MKRSLAILALGGLLLSAPSALAEEPHLDFVRALRARHFNDLAMEYLLKLSQKPTPELARELPLELARTRLELAREEADLGKRVEMYTQARKEFEQFAKANPGKEGEAQLEIANVAVLQGKAQLGRAEREENAAARSGEMLKARTALEEAGTFLDGAATRIRAQLEKLGDAKTPQEQAARRALDQARLQAEYQKGLNLFDQAMTYANQGDLKVLKVRGDLVKQAQDQLSRVEGVDARNPLCWQAAAWIGRCYHEGGDPKKARQRFENIMNDTTPAAEAGKRLAAWFRILVLPEAVQGKENPLDLMQLSAEQWLQRYRPFLNTPEGQAVTYRLAEIYYDKALAAKAAKDAPIRKSYYDRARELFRQLEQSDNDYTDRARDRKVRIIFASQGGPVGDVSKFTTFEDCYVRAQFDIFQLQEDPKEIKDPKELEKKRKERLATIVTALTRALKIAETGKPVKVPERDVLTATAMLAYVHYSTSDWPQAIKVSESLVYGKSGTAQAPVAAVYALESYAQLLADAEKAEEYRPGMNKLLAFVKERWANEPIADTARHQQGLALMREKKFPEAVAELAAIKPTYANAIHAKWQLAAAAFQAEKDQAKPIGPDKRPFQVQAIAALESMPELPPGADTTTAHIYIASRIQLGQQLYTQKKYKEMETLSATTLKKLDDLKFENENIRADLKAGLASLSLYARYGQSEADYSAGRYAEVRKVLDPVIDSAKGGKLPELKSNAQLRFALLGLALRANVLDNNMKRAQEVIQVLQSYADEKDGGKSEAILQPIVLMMREQIDELRRKNQKEQLAKTVKSFSDFLDLLRAQQKQPTPEFLFLVGQSYVSLAKYADAVKMLTQFKAPPDGDDKAARLYRAARLLLMRALRESGQLDKAEEVLKEVMTEPWGKNNLEAMKEQGHLMDAREKFGNAAQHWNGLLKTLQPRIQTDPNAKDQYFEIYLFLVQSYYKFGANNPDAKKKDQYIKAAAGFITKLENSWPDLGGEVSKARFTELLGKEPVLKKEYELLKAENK